MKTFFIVLLGIATIVLGVRTVSLQKGLKNARESAEFYNKRSSELQNELISVSRANEESKRTLADIDESVKELEKKVDLDKLQRYIPKKTWDEIKPIIDRLQTSNESK